MADDFGPDEAPPPPVLPIGDIEELRAHLWRKHQVTVDPSDPILMVWTINQVALDDFDRRLERSNDALAERLERIAAGVAAEVHHIVEEFEAETIETAARERIAAVDEASKQAAIAVAAFRRSVRLLTILTVINFVAVMFVIGVLTVLVR